MSTQDQIWLSTEGDNWYQRNKIAMSGAEQVYANRVLNVVKAFPDLKPQSIADIGCSSGGLLHELKRVYDAKCVGIEPSAKAIEEGKAMFPELEFRRGVLSELPAKDGEFDLVAVSFVLCVVDRSTLLASLAEVDRVLCDDGFLVLCDFLPYVPHRRVFHHVPDAAVHTYKLDYAAILKATGLYSEVMRVVFEHGNLSTTSRNAPSDRCATTLLRKSFHLGTPDQA